MRETKQAGGMEPEEAAVSLTGALTQARVGMVAPEAEPAAGTWAGRLTDWAARHPRAPLLLADAGALTVIMAVYVPFQYIADRRIPLLAAGDANDRHGFTIRSIVAITVVMAVFGCLLVLWALHEPPRTFDNWRLMPADLVLPLLILGPGFGLWSAVRAIAHWLAIRRWERANQKRIEMRARCRGEVGWDR